MKVTREKAEENRQNVIETSSRLFREKGFDGVGVSTLMQAAGLTHGGFYKQFKSKDDLIAQATRAALDQTRKRLSAVKGENGVTSFETVVRAYLSETHRDAVGQGCALAALGADAARHGPDVRQVMQQAVEEFLALLAASVEVEISEAARDKAVATLATMVGALVLSRAVADVDLSKEILKTATREVLPSASNEDPGRDTLQ